MVHQVYHRHNRHLCPEDRSYWILEDELQYYKVYLRKRTDKKSVEVFFKVLRLSSTYLNLYLSI